MRHLFLLISIVVTSGCSQDKLQSSQNISVSIDVSKGIDLNFQIDPDGNPILFIYNIKPSLVF